MNKEFSLGQVLSITTGKLLCDMDDIYDILNYMTGSNLFTHQLPRASRTVRPYLKKWMESTVPLFDKIDRDEIQAGNANDWLSEKEKVFGKTFFLSPLPYGVYEKMDPIEELVNIRKKG